MSDDVQSADDVVVQEETVSEIDDAINKPRVATIDDLQFLKKNVEDDIEDVEVGKDKDGKPICFHLRTPSMTEIYSNGTKMMETMDGDTINGEAQNKIIMQSCIVSPEPTDEVIELLQADASAYLAVLSASIKKVSAVQSEFGQMESIF